MTHKDAEPIPASRGEALAIALPADLDRRCAAELQRVLIDALDHPAITRARVANGKPAAAPPPPAGADGQSWEEF